MRQFLKMVNLHYRVLADPLRLQIKRLLWGTALALLGALFAFSIRPVDAQSQSSAWNTPINLSESGGTTDPKIVQSSDGIYHVFWRDTYAGIVYTSGDGQTWSTPSSGEFPFSEAAQIPIFLANQNEQIHAFWLGEDDILLYAKVSSSQAGNPASWSPALQVAEASLDFDVTIDDQDLIHLLYARPLDSADFPAGVYYRQSRDNGNNWSGGQSLFVTKYYRSLDLIDSNVDISVDGENIYAVWDHRPLRRVYFAASPNRGTTWNSPLEIDGPSQNAGDNLPYDIRISGTNGQLIAIWQVGQPSFNCTQHYRTSNNQGQDWSTINRMLRNTGGCPLDNRFLGDLDPDSGVTLLATNILRQYYLSAWNGEKWSEVIPQTALSNFTDQATLNIIQMHCWDFLKSGGNLLVVGCDEGTGKDIWFSQRSINSSELFFPPATAWSSPLVIYTSEYRAASPVLIPDQFGFVHAFWIQESTARTSPGNLPQLVPASIYYSRWDGSSWLRPAEIIKPLDGLIKNLSVGLDKQGRLHLGWIAGLSGQLYYSWNSIDDASSAALWSTPVTVPGTRGNGSTLEVKIDQNDAIHIVSSLPINESRGIQYIRSSDLGATWDEPILLFDAGAAGWDRIDDPHLAIASDGSYHVIFTRYSFTTQVSQGIYYSTSNDRGLTWSSPLPLTDSTVIWSSLAVSDSNTIHRIWAALDNLNITIIHEYSQDNGLTWIRSSTLPGTAQLLGQIGLSITPSGRLHLLASTRVSDIEEIQHWVWDSGSWTSESPISLALSEQSSAAWVSLPLVSTITNKLVLIYPDEKLVTLLDSEQAFSLVSLSREISGDTGSLPTEPSPITTPILIQTNTPSPTDLTPTPSPTPDLAALMNQGGPTGIFANQYASLIIGAGLSGLLVAAVLLYKLRSSNKAK